MIRIDSDSHFTPLDAFDEVDPRYLEIGPHFEILPSGRYKVIYHAKRIARESLRSKQEIPSYRNISSLCERKAILPRIWIRRQGSMPWPKMDLICRC